MKDMKHMKKRNLAAPKLFMPFMFFMVPLGFWSED